MVELGDDSVIYAFGPEVPPVLTVPSGATVRIRTKDCFGNQVQTPEDELDEDRLGSHQSRYRPHFR